MPYDSFGRGSRARREAEVIATYEVTVGLSVNILTTGDEVDDLDQIQQVFQDALRKVRPELEDVGLSLEVEDGPPHLDYYWRCG